MRRSPTTPNLTKRTQHLSVVNQPDPQAVFDDLIVHIGPTLMAPRLAEYLTNRRTFNCFQAAVAIYEPASEVRRALEELTSVGILVATGQPGTNSRRYSLADEQVTS
jgi:hypothetical protein